MSIINKNTFNHLKSRKLFPMLQNFKNRKLKMKKTSLLYFCNRFFENKHVKNTNFLDYAAYFILKYSKAISFQGLNKFREIYFEKLFTNLPHHKNINLQVH